MGRNGFCVRFSRCHQHTLLVSLCILAFGLKERVASLSLALAQIAFTLGQESPLANQTHTMARYGESRTYAGEGRIGKPPQNAG